MDGVRYIEIKVPLGTSLEEIQTIAMQQAYKLAGTQLMAAVSLGICPETLCRRLRKHKKLACSEETATTKLAVDARADPSFPGGQEDENRS